MPPVILIKKADGTKQPVKSPQQLKSKAPQNAFELEVWVFVLLFWSYAACQVSGEVQALYHHEPWPPHACSPQETLVREGEKISLWQ